MILDLGPRENYLYIDGGTPKFKIIYLEEDSMNDINMLNLALLVLGGFGTLYQSIREAGGNRVTKVGSKLSALTQLVILLYGTYVLDLSVVYIYFGLLVLVMGFILISYYRGPHYSVRSENKELLLNLIYDAVKEIEYTKPERVESDNQIEFRIPDCKKTLEFQEKESFSGDKKVYSIRFKRWLNNETRKGILSYIEDGLREQEELKIKKVKMTAQIVFSIVLVCFLLFISSKSVMEPNDFDAALLEKKAPVELYFNRTDITIDDTDLIMKVHKELKNHYFYRNRNETLRDIQELIATLHYQDEAIKVYFIKGYEDNLFANMYVNDSVIGEKSIIHRFLWWVHRLYDREDGVFYRVFLDQDTIKDIFSEIEGYN